MSLEQLKAEAEAEETQATEQPEFEGKPKHERLKDLEEERDAHLAEDGKDEKPEAEEAEESEDFELELEGEPEPDQQKYDPVQVLQHKLSRERKKKREAKTEVDDLRDQVSKLTQMLQGGQQAQSQQAPQTRSAAEPVFPDLYDQGIDGDRQKYDSAVKRYFADINAYQSRHNEAEQVQSKNRERMENMTKSLATRAAKFSKEHNVSVDRVADALDKATSEVDEATGIDGALAYLLDSVGDGGERVAYYIGTNGTAMSQLKGLLRDDPQGFKAISHMTRLAEKLKPKHSKRISKAPEPDQPIKGDGAPASSRKLQEMYDKASTKSDIKGMREAKRLAEQRGVKLK